MIKGLKGKIGKYNYKLTVWPLTKRNECQSGIITNFECQSGVPLNKRVSKGQWPIIQIFSVK